MNPHQTMMMDVSYQALHAAGFQKGTLSRSGTGVFVGCSSIIAHLKSYQTGNVAHIMMGSASSIVANRVSFLLGLLGPSLVVDTACSSAMVALNIGVQAQTLSPSVVGGVNIINLDTSVILL